jgi:hypothetical protein
MSLVWPILLVGVAVVAAVSILLLVRRRAPEGSYFADGDRAAGIFGVLATGAEAVVRLPIIPFGRCGATALARSFTG